MPHQCPTNDEGKKAAALLLIGHNRCPALQRVGYHEQVGAQETLGPVSLRVRPFPTSWADSLSLASPGVLADVAVLGLQAGLSVRRSGRPLGAAWGCDDVQRWGRHQVDERRAALPREEEHGKEVEPDRQVRRFEHTVQSDPDQHPRGARLGEES